MGIKGAPVRYVILFLSEERQECPKHGPETQRLVPYSQGTMVYMRNLRRSLSKGNSPLRPLEGARETIYQRSHTEG